MAGRPSPVPMRIAEVVVANAVPVVGVVALGWQAIAVVFLYLLDAWLSILALGASVMIAHRAELSAMLAKHPPVRRALYWVASVVLVEVCLSVFAAVPGFAAIAHMAPTLEGAVKAVFAEPGVWISLGLVVASHALRLRRVARRAEEGIEALTPKQQMMLFIHRLFFMMALSWLASPGFLSRLFIPLYVLLVAALFTYSDLYPERFLARVMSRMDRERVGLRDAVPPRGR